MQFQSLDIIDPILRKSEVTPGNTTPTRRQNQKMKLFPNPVRENLFFEIIYPKPENISDDIDLKYEIFTITGQAVESGNVTNNQIPVNHLVNQAYLIRIFSGNGEISITDRFIKQ